MDTVEEAEELRGHVLSMSARDRPEIDDDDEFYVQELIGMQVCYTHTGIQKILAMLRSRKMRISRAAVL